MIQKFQALPQNIRHLSIVSLIAFLVSLPALLAHYPDTQDTIFAFMAFRSFSEQFYFGEFYPRWLFDFYNFYGAPMFYYYPPLIFYFEVMLDIVTLKFLPDLLILGIAGFIMVLGSGIACYYWLKDLYGAQKAFIPSIIYMLLPNHLALDLYYKGTLTELSAYLWLPLLLLFIRRSLYHRRGWIVVSMLYAGLILSTVPMALALSPLLLLYAGYEVFNQYKNEQKFKPALLKPFFALLIGFSLTGFYIVTAYLMTDYINQDKFWVEFYDPRKWFMCLSECANSASPLISKYFTWLHLGQGFTIAALFAFAYKIKKLERPSSIFWMLMSMGVLFMMSKYSLFIWDHAPLVERIQFPWRLAVILDLGLVYFITKAFPLSRTQMGQSGLTLLVSLAAFTVLCAYLTHTFYDRGALYQPDDYNKMVDRRDYFGVYIPPFTEVTRMDLVNDPKASQKIWIEDARGKIKNIVTERIPYGFKFEVDHNHAAPVHIRQLFYPTWQAYSLESGQQYKLSVSEPMGNMTLDYPGGKDTIILAHKTVWQEKIGWGFTFAALLVLLGGYFLGRRKVAIAS